MTVDADLPERLLHVLRMMTGIPELAYAQEPQVLSGGFWAELLAFSLTGPPAGWPRELVARLMPDPGLARKETIVQTAVAAAGYPTPAVRASGGPDCGLGRAFMVMDHAAGAPLLSGLSGTGAIAGALRVLGQLPQVLASSMARLHVLDPHDIREQLSQASDVPTTAGDLLDELQDTAARYGRTDLADAATWLTGHPAPSAAEVVCHGDLHPFNLLADGDQVTVVDWSAALLAPRAHDVAVTTLLLAEPPLLVASPLRPVVRAVGRRLASQFFRQYQESTNTTIGMKELHWHQALVCLRALVEVAGWVHDGTADERRGHPWLVTGSALAARLNSVTR
ncbi:MAG TPA: phosphotransferase [Streptosporangiaceae bacterium]|nr:phosphotransferase [Streptosporangiaceae bacterium]